jgi:ubiquinone/menaquinone biosynthesis C-methylase UbiE
MAPRDPAYLERILRWRARLRAAGHAGPVFMHLGAFQGAEDASDEAALLRAQARLNDRVLALADIAPGACVADVGCGLGGTLRTLAERDASLRLVGLGPSARELSVAREEIAATPSRALLLRADACALPLGGASVDRVLAIECALHFPSRAAFFREAARSAQAAAWC